jgi:hypothetical protein
LGTQSNRSNQIERATDSQPGLDHGADIAMAEQFLDGPDISSRLEQPGQVTSVPHSAGQKNDLVAIWVVRTAVYSGTDCGIAWSDETQELEEVPESSQSMLSRGLDRSIFGRK